MGKEYKRNGVRLVVEVNRTARIFNPEDRLSIFKGDDGIFIGKSNYRHDMHLGIAVVFFKRKIGTDFYEMKTLGHVPDLDIAYLLAESFIDTITSN